MQCQVSVTMPGKPAVVIREVQENMYNAIDRAVKRASYRVGLIVSRGHQTIRQTARPAVTSPSGTAVDAITQD